MHSLLWGGHAGRVGTFNKIIAFTELGKQALVPQPPALCRFARTRRAKRLTLMTCLLWMSVRVIHRQALGGGGGVQFLVGGDQGDAGQAQGKPAALNLPATASCTES